MSKRALTPHLVLAGLVQLNEEATPAADDRPLLLRSREMRRTRPAGTSDFDDGLAPMNNIALPDCSSPKNFLCPPPVHLAIWQNLVSIARLDLILRESLISESYPTRRPRSNEGDIVPPRRLTPPPYVPNSRAFTGGSGAGSTSTSDWKRKFCRSSSF